jgi:hypothetical protein
MGSRKLTLRSYVYGCDDCNKIDIGMPEKNGIMCTE